MDSIMETSESSVPPLTESTCLTPTSDRKVHDGAVVSFATPHDQALATPDHESQHSSEGGGSRTKFASKELRGNLTRRQLNRNPLKYYEIANVLGVGSMGSVTMVRKRSSAVGGSARKSVQDEVRREHQLQQCFELPVLGQFFHFLFLKFSAASSSSDPSSSDGESVRTSDWVKKSTGSDDASSDSRSNAIIYAMKSIHLSRCTNETFVEELKNEIEILKTLDHPHIVKAIETFDYHHQLFVVMELCSGGDLYRRDPYTEDEAARITSAILSAISYMHSKNILHRDLKYENVLFVDESPLAEVKLIDFGLSTQFFDTEKELTDGVGTIYTMAPEVLKGSYTKQADLWSVGVIAYMLMSSQMPFYGRKRKDIVDQIMEGKYEYKGRRWKRISKAGKAFVDDLLVVDPDDRATSDEAIKASWLNRRFGATVRNPKIEEMDSAKDSLCRFASYSKLRQVALMVIAHKSTSAEIGMLRKIFQQYDTDGVGHLNFQQFKGAIADPKLTEADYRRIFDAVDLDGSGKIRYTEFLAATIEANGSVSEVRLAEAFDRLDSDDSGYISVENLLEILGDGFAKEDVEAIIKEAASDNDGQISYAEFLALWEHKQLDCDDTLDAHHHDVKMVNVVKRNEFDSERSAGISLLSSDIEELDPISDKNDPLARAHFIQGKIESERNVILEGKRRRSVSFTVDAIEVIP